MTARIDPTSRVEDGAILADDVTVGPFCHVGPDARIGAGTRLLSYVSITGRTTIGGGCTIYPFAALGGPPQSLSHKGEPTELVIGEGCTIRESVTMSTGTVGGGGITRVGDRNFFMNGSHVGHDCILGNDIVVAGTAMIAGHCEIGDFVFIGGVTAMHQFTRIGKGAMLGGMSGISTDLIPYGLASGARCTLIGLNAVGMKRRGFTASRLGKVKEFYKRLFLRDGLFSERLADARQMADEDPGIAEILAFIDKGGKHALCQPSAGSD
jgi:UDP-N-acetylglucosamine acyltransferase